MSRSGGGNDRREGTVNVVKGEGACRGSLVGEGKPWGGAAAEVGWGRRGGAWGASEKALEPRGWRSSEGTRLHRAVTGVGLWVRRGASCERCACEGMRRRPLFDPFPMSSDIDISAVLLRLKFGGAIFPDKLSAYSAQFCFSMQSCFWLCSCFALGHRLEQRQTGSGRSMVWLRIEEDCSK